jgi:hypothetical protein
MPENDATNYGTFEKAKKDIEDSRENISSFIKCNHIYTDIPTIESKVCKTGLSDMFSLIQLYLWLSIISLLVSVGINRLKPLVEKKKYELDSMVNDCD